MRAEIKRIHNKVGTTTVYVTHDQTEAMTMADRIIVMKNRFIQQIGTPKELYFSPQNIFVAGFIGDPQMNFFKGSVKGHIFTSEDGTKVDLSTYNSSILEKAEKLDKVVMGFRPESCSCEDLTGNDHISETMNVEVSEMLGDTMNIYGYLGKNNMVIRTTPFTKFEVNNPFNFYVKFDHIVFFDGKTENIIK